MPKLGWSTYASPVTKTTSQASQPRHDISARVVGKKGQERTFQIVGANESDPTSGKLSHASPVGRAVLKRRVGDKVTVSTPRGATEYEIVNVEVAS